MQTVGFIGLGKIGHPMAEQVQQGGFELCVCDVNEAAAADLVEQGAHFVATPSEVAARCDVVLTSLPGPSELETVVAGPSGLLEGSREGLVHCDLSTISLAAARAMREREAAAGIHFIDSPVSGGVWAARKGALALMVSGAREAYDVAHPVLDTLAKQIFYLGEEAGTGTLFKLINNAVFLSAGQALQEGLVLGAKAGVDMQDLAKVLQASSAGMYCGLLGPMLARAWDQSAFDLRLAHKDVGLAIETAEDLGVPLQLTRAAFATYGDAMQDDLGEKFFIATLAALERRADTEVPKTELSKDG